MSIDNIPSKEDFDNALILRQGKYLQQKLNNTCVAICGLGGLGSNIAISLARAGINKLILIDFDKVDISNLHRQQYKANQIGQYKTHALSNNLKEFMPYINLTIHTIKITDDNLYDLLKEADIICEAFDNAICKSMLVNKTLEYFPDKYIVAASGMAGIDSPNTIKTRKITNKFYLCGDGISDVNNTISLLSSRVSLCAAHQAHTIIRIIAEQYEI